MVKRGAGVLLALLLWGCPDDIGNVMNGAVIGLRAPGDLDGVPNGGSEVLLTWKDRATGESGYRVEMNPVPFGTPVIGGVEYLPADATATAFPVFPNSTYYFRVFAITAVMESDPSNVIVVTTPDVPPRPTNVVATPVSSTQINLTWIDGGGEIGYSLEMSTNGADWSPAISVSANVTSSARTGMAPDSEYYFRVIAQGANGPSTPSLPVRAQTLAAVDTALVFNPDAGLFTSYAVTGSGTEHLAHYEVVSGKPLFTTRTYPGSYQTFAIENGPPQVGGDGTSLAVDAAGKVHLVAHNLTNDTLRYFTNVSGNWVAATLDPKIAGGKPRIVWDPATGWLHAYAHARWSLNSPIILHTWKAPGLPWVVASTPLPAEVDHAATFSVAVDAAGNRHIALVTLLQGLRVVHDTGIPGPGGSPYQPEDIPLPAGARPDFTSIAAGAAGQLHVVYHDSSIGGLHHATKISGSWVIEDIDVVAGQDLGTYCSLAIHPPTGRLHVAYYDATNRDLRYARKDPAGAWIRKVFDVVGDVGSHASIALDAAGAVHIAYRDATSLRLRVATGAP